MFEKLLEFVFDRMGKTRVWSVISTPAVWIVAFLAAHMAGYKYIEWRHGVSPSLYFYVRGYIAALVTLSFLLGTGILLAIGWPIEREGNQTAGWLRELFRRHRKTIVWRCTCLLLMVLLFGLLMACCLPKRATDIEVAFLSGTNFDKHAFAYIIYELNKRQKHWYFDVRFQELNTNALVPEERVEADADNGGALWCAKHWAEGKPFIVITPQSLGDHFFWDHDGIVSAISTYQWDEVFAPPSVYEYLAYSLIANSILIHLSHCGKDPPDGAFKVLEHTRGDLYEVLTDRKAIKPAILAARLTPQGEQLLLNSFGFEYMRTCSSLLTLDWLRSSPVKENLIRCFGVDVEAKLSPTSERSRGLSAGIEGVER